MSIEQSTVSGVHHQPTAAPTTTAVYLPATQRSWDVAVVGGGVVGAATARTLAKRGRAVILLEAGELATAGGSSRGTARIWHLAGYPSDEYFDHAVRALEGWRELERETGTTLLLTTSGGGLSTGTGVEHQADLLASAGRDAQLLTAQDIARRWPAVTLPVNGPVLYQRDSGVILASLALAALLASAENAGASLVDCATVRALHTESGAARLETDAGTITATCVVVTAGAWSRKLLADAGIGLDVDVCEQTVGWFPWKGPAPPILIEYDDPGPYWLLDPGRGLKAALHTPGRWITDPNEPYGVGAREDVDRVAEWVAERLPSADPQPLGIETCRYTWATSERFTIERHGPVIVGSACSGRGFQHAPHTAELLAELTA
jgi:sarcosine oxidase